MASRTASLPRTTTSRPPWETVVAAAAVLSLVLWPVQIHRAFGLPAHPLLLHVPVIFVPILGLAAIGAALSPRLYEPRATALAAFAVVTNAATLLTVGAGEAFRDDRPGGAADKALSAHADAAEMLRWLVIGLTALLVIALFVRGRRVLLGAAAVVAVAAIFFVIRTGHLGAKLAWGEREGGPPAGFSGGRPPAGGGQALNGG